MSSHVRQVIATFALVPAIAVANSGTIRVTSIRSWSQPGSTRIILQTTGRFDYRSNRAYNPDRLFFDILHARPWIANRRYAMHTVNDGVVKRVRIAETTPGTTRVVFDLAGPADYRVKRFENPDRMVIEIRAQHEPWRRPAAPAYASRLELRPALDLAPHPYSESAAYHSSNFGYEPADQESAAAREFVFPPPKLLKTLVLLPVPPLDQTVAPLQPVFISSVVLPGPAALQKYVRGAPTRTRAAARVALNDSVPRPPDNSARSLTRALGLKVNRIVIDAGHGGHDEGTVGPHGVREKDVVLDVALRLASLIRSRMGAEVILTRSDDTFIPLHERTAIANDCKADLFLSIHANSSPSPSVGGTETFYLNFTNNSSALDVAARENAGSDRSVGELKDLIQSITLNDKIAESETFARDVQAPLFAQASTGNTSARDRGVKRAPFVVLIGASMPSVLAEIGFLSNPRDERNLNRPDYRQKIAEALYRGVSQYSKSLSHFEVATTAAPRASARGN